MAEARATMSVQGYRWDSILCGYRAGEKLKERRSIVCWSRYVLPIVLDTHVISSLPLLAVGSTEPRATNGRILDPFERKFIEKNQLYFANTNKRSEWHREQGKPFNNQNPFSPKFWTEGRQKEAICPDCRQPSPSGYIRIVRIEQKVHQMQYLPPPPPLNAAAAAVRRHAIRI